MAFLPDYLQLQNHKKFISREVVNLSNITTSNSGATKKTTCLQPSMPELWFVQIIAEPIALEAGLLLEGKGAKADTYRTSSTVTISVQC